jgi:hypothetical protein
MIYLFLLFYPLKQYTHINLPGVLFCFYMLNVSAQTFWAWTCVWYQGRKLLWFTFSEMHAKILTPLSSTHTHSPFPLRMTHDGNGRRLVGWAISYSHRHKHAQPICFSQLLLLSNGVYTSGPPSAAFLTLSVDNRSHLAPGGIPISVCWS